MKTVLTVDDSKVVRSMVVLGLQAFGCKVIEAGNGLEGVAAARQHDPDLVLLDITMPVMDGREALAELRRDAATKGIPVIVLTAEGGRDVVVEVARLGISGYVVKPFQVQTFEREVSKVLGPPNAASVSGSAEDLLRTMLAEEQGCSVLHLPDPRSRAFGRIMPVLRKQLRALAEGGADKLIVDLQQVGAVSSELITSLSRLIADADRLGIRTAVCTASAAVQTGLREIAEVRDTPCRPDRDAARASLR